MIPQTSTSFPMGRLPSRTCSSFRSSIFQIDVQRAGNTIDQDRYRALVSHDFGGRGEGHGGHQDPHPGRSPSASTARCMAAVQEFTAMPY